MFRRISTVVLAVVVSLYLGCSLPGWSNASWIDPITGSSKHQARWFVFDGPAKVERSELEVWIVRHEGSYAPTWEFLSRGTRSILGIGITRACSLSPPIYPLHAGDRNTEFVRQSTDEQIAEFVRVMREGSNEEQKMAVEAAIDRLTEDR